MQLNEITARTADLGREIPEKQKKLQEWNQVSMQTRVMQQSVQGEIVRLNLKDEQYAAKINELQRSPRDENGNLPSAVQAQIARQQDLRRGIQQEIQKHNSALRELQQKNARVQEEIRVLQSTLQAYGKTLQTLLGEAHQNVVKTQTAAEKLMGAAQNPFAQAAARDARTQLGKYIGDTIAQEQKIQSLMRMVGMEVPDPASQQGAQAAAGQQGTQAAAGAHQRQDAAGGQMDTEEVPGGFSRRRSLANDMHMSYGTERGTPVYTSWQEPDRPQPAQGAQAAAGAQQWQDTAGWQMDTEKVPGGRSRSHSLEEDRHIVFQAERRAPGYTSMQGPDWPQPARDAQPEDLLRSMRGNPAQGTASAEEMAASFDEETGRGRGR